ncbi:protocatechuate 3,4-dioxygenase subunit alpha [Mycobacterium sp. 852002-51163_SCH5372311]|uniref:protocatechuate 3,4-dioxygenase subunit alpha n=1 Tax=Mycobacterium sp. 852002-51163_SCH5372311 TaxID=1834097 RepID=UPI0007FB7B84|nr:protocatechuate 3,4-dioxygenase subunit alpha [Mycobacterium sp. 852002-51163_SCH5372311]OBF80232.1 protocatechuate 3,4-dioxygenase subunit alpha [Mycobacterium sp. 852002-51163_SCH5372311]
MAELSCTPGQTVGPFFGVALPYRGGGSLVSDAHPDAVHLHGTVYDGAGHGVPDALVELWQPDSAGRIVRQAGSLRRDGSGFTGWGRAATDSDGRYVFTTVRPGVASRRRIAPRGPRACDSASARQGNAAFFAIAVFARGLLNRLFTRAYLPGADLDADPLLSTVDPTRRATLLCAAESGYRFDIHLQGPNETVFVTFEDDPGDPR